ncbi:histidine phosphatase family protein [Kitasatospora sp. NPDC093558]|uniref:histidine phosphatase family protein n=1 Tax=Kitasatospora sp. NPDC093558 TaxID=3155201 RepID=UPI0034146A8D
MGGATVRYLYLVRHGEALPDESGLSEVGRRQASLLGRRLAGRPITAVHHGPLARAAQTAGLIAEHLPAVSVQACDAAGDYVPYVPGRAELPSDGADHFLRFLAQAEPHASGPELARQAVASFTGPVAGDQERHELVVTHNFLIAWLVRHALDAPAWRWLGLNHGHASLTVIRYAPGRPASPLVVNDLGHLPEDLRWTGFPPGYRV